MSNKTPGFSPNEGDTLRRGRAAPMPGFISPRAYQLVEEGDLSLTALGVLAILNAHPDVAMTPQGVRGERPDAIVSIREALSELAAVGFVEEIPGHPGYYAVTAEVSR